MSNYIKLINNLDYLKLDTFKQNIDFYVDLVNKGEKSFVDALYELTEKDKDFRTERANIAMVKTANFPFVKTFDDFDFSYQPSINKNEILDFKELRFMQNAENILFIGTPGTGKTHLAVSTGIAAARNRFMTYFINCNDLIAQLKKAQLENRLQQRLKHYFSYSLLIIDEVGFLPINHEDANLFFQLIAMRYEKRSTIITTNKSFNKWGEVFGDSVIANAILDRLLHHSKVVQIIGPSYRLKDKKYLMEDAE